MKFDYIARDGSGAGVSGVIESPSRDEALVLLAERFPVVTSLQPARGHDVRGIPGLRGHVRPDDVLGFTQALASTCEAGLNIVTALRIYERDCPNPAMRAVCASIASEVAAGHPLSQALDAHPTVFDGVFRQTVRAGESSGQLARVLNRAADYLESNERIRERIRSATTYPAVVLVFTFLCGGLVLSFGVPQLESVYRDMGQELPFATRIFVGVFGFVWHHAVAAAALAAAAVVLAAAALRSPPGRRALDRLKLRVPPFAGLYRLLYTSRFTGTLAILYSSGVPLVESVHMAAGAVDNSVVRADLERMARHLEQGLSMSSFLADNPILTDMAAGLIGAGEESGQLDAMLDRVARHYEMKFTSGVTALMAGFEPMLMVGVGLVVGSLIILLGLPFMNLAATL